MTTTVKDTRAKLRRSKALTRKLGEMGGIADERMKLWAELVDVHGVSLADIARNDGVTIGAVSKAIAKVRRAGS